MIEFSQSQKGNKLNTNTQGYLFNYLVYTERVEKIIWLCTEYTGKNYSTRCYTTTDLFYKLF